jgi:hypothetical protein
MKRRGSDLGKRFNPVGGWGQATQYGHKTAFPPDQGVRVLSAGDVPSGFFDAPNDAFKISSGTRQQRLRDGLQPLGRQCRGALLQVSHHVQEVFVRTAVAQIVYTGSER